MQRKLRLQLKGKILKSSLHSLYPGTKNVTFVNKPIPIRWSETEETIDPESAEEYRSQVNKLGGQENLLYKTEGLGTWADHCLRPATIKTVPAIT